MDRKTFLAFSCPHCPYEDGDALDWLLLQIHQARPDVLVHLGDGHDACAASRFDDEAAHDLRLEFVRHNALLASLRKAAGTRCRLVFCEGNHDANTRAIARIPKDLRQLVDYRLHEPELRHWRFVPYVNDPNAGVYRLGCQVSFSHGMEVSRAGIRRDQMTFTREFGLFVHGHTHRPTPEGPAERLLWGDYPVNWWRANPGCMRDMDKTGSLHWASRQNTQRWGQGCVVGTAAPLKSPRARPEWSCETRVFKTYDQWSRHAIKKGLVRC